MHSSDHTGPLFFVDPLQHALLITTFIMMVMLIIEYLNVWTSGTWSKHLKSASWLQVLFAGFMGILPGCLGTYTVVSLYAHRIMNFASLVTVMIATSGDEAFLMLAMIPKTFLILTLIIFIIAVLTGLILNLFPRISGFQPFSEHHRLPIHHEDHECRCFQKETIIPQLRALSFTRALLIAGGILVIVFVGLGQIGPDEWNWMRIVLFSGSIISLFIIMTVPEHFLMAHLWEHIIKKHFVKILLWSLGTLIALHFIEDQIEIRRWMDANLVWVILIAALVGLLPTSGPHLVFITLFASGAIPFSVLLANSIVQDGHGSLPLLAESKKSFLYMKLVNFSVALIFSFLMVLLESYISGSFL
jgi:hypothetical protein